MILLQCLKPVIAAVHGNCIGGGIDTITACDIRYCTEDANFVAKVKVLLSYICLPIKNCLESPLRSR